MTRVLNQWLDYLSGEGSAASGEGLEASIEHSWTWPAWLTLLVVLAAVAVIVACYVRERTESGRLLRGVLVAIRVALVLLVLFMLYGWTRQRHRTDLPDVAIVIDESASMAVADLFPDAAAQSELSSRVRAAGFEGATRINLAKTLLLEKNGSFLRTLGDRYHPRVYLIGAAARAIGSGASLDQSLRELKAEAPTSRLGKGLADVLQMQRGRPTAAIVLLTDGVTTEGKPLSEVAEQARRRQIPLYLVGLGNDKPPRDVKLGDLLVDNVAFVNDQLHFDFKLTSSGYEGRAAKVRVRRKDNSAPLAETTVKFGKDGEPVPTRLTIRPREKGEFEYIVEVEPLEGETTASNNAVSRTVTVSEETIRVLFAHGYPNYDFRFLKTLLGRELKSGEADGERAFTLKTVLQEADLEYAQQDETAERVFPVSQEELFRYDVLIFGDCQPSLFTSSALSLIADFVKVRGGSVVFLAGPRWLPHAYRDSPLAELFPISLETTHVPDAETPIVEPLAAQLTPLGMATPFLQVDETPEANARIWRGMPPLYWSLDAADAKPGARVLIENGSRTGMRGQTAPLVTLQFVGAGKVVFHASDETWRWSRHRDGDQYYARYWVQLLRYLSRARLLGANHTIQLTTDRDQYQRGETVRLRTRFFDERLAPATDDGVTVVLEREGSGRRNVQLTRDATSRGFFEGTISGLSDGVYRVWLATPTLPSQPPSARFSITVPQGEQARLEADTADLRAAAKTSAGRFFTFAQTGDLMKELPPGRHVRIESLPPEPIWNLWPLPMLFVVLIVTEWLLRKRAGML